MKISLSKALALGGVCALFVGAGTTAFAQGYDHQDRHFDQGYRAGDRPFDQGWDHRDFGRARPVTENERQRLARLHHVYTVAARSGHYVAAEKAHLHAQAIRRDLYAHRNLRQDRRDRHDDSGY